MELDYRTYFEHWRNWETFEDRFDGVNGVYAFRLKRAFGRLRGSSDILYIGKAEQDPARNKRPGIWHRLNNYRQPNSGSSARLRQVEACFGGRSKIEYAYRECENPAEAERALLDDYYARHMEMPPLNRASGKRSQGNAS
ncbi:MAG TPA: hypothetical protein ENN80_04730 [Candidatus Hydrogenedentes bacterium]|nr:hypothetical protein [Candidatus Hydrogenedentota bacterium]